MAYVLADQRASAAFLAITWRSLEDSFLALAGPPFKPPLCPIFDKYWEMAKAIVFSSDDCLLERLMHEV